MCGKRLNSCAIRYGHEPTGTGVKMTRVNINITSAGTIQTGGIGYTSVPSITFTGGGGSGAAATATVAGGILTKITMTAVGTGYTSIPNVVIASAGASVVATATAIINDRGTRNVSLPFGGFPGAALY